MRPNVTLYADASSLKPTGAIDTGNLSPTQTLSKQLDLEVSFIHEHNVF